MSPEERDPAYLWDMLQAARDIAEFTQGMIFEQFSAGHRTRYAVERQFMVIGEAAGRVSKTFRERHPAPDRFSSGGSATRRNT